MGEFVRDSLSFLSLRRLFYLVTPSETTFPSVAEVPPIIDQAFLWFFIFIGLELLFDWTKGGQKLYRGDDTITSLGGGLLQSMVKVVFRSIEIKAFGWIYANYRVYEFPWDSKSAWFLSFLGVEFAYYWFHRLSHEMNFIWASHQMHHSSEYYNLSTALRQGMFQPYFSIWFYLPMAFFLAPQLHIVHGSLNLLYQFWIHTQVIRSLGPLELILNTPSHHRVHHGRNPYCIDKNYGGTLIIWDRLFGTFRAEREEEPVVYGLVHPVTSFNQLYCQLFIYREALWSKPRSMNTLWNAIQAPFRGPGWQPGVVVKDSADGIPELAREERRSAENRQFLMKKELFESEGVQSLLKAKLGLGLYCTKSFNDPEAVFVKGYGESEQVSTWAEKMQQLMPEKEDQRIERLEMENNGMKTELRAVNSKLDRLLSKLDKKVGEEEAEGGAG